MGLKLDEGQYVTGKKRHFEFACGRSKKNAKAAIRADFRTVVKAQRVVCDSHTYLRVQMLSRSIERHRANFAQSDPAIGSDKRQHVK